MTGRNKSVRLAARLPIWRRPSRLRYEWGVRKAWRSPFAMLRGLWWAVVRGYWGEICESCGQPIAPQIGETCWRAEDDLWERVEGHRGGLLCPACFTADAAAKGISITWRPVHDA